MQRIFRETEPIGDTYKILYRRYKHRQGKEIEAVNWLTECPLGTQALMIMGAKIYSQKAGDPGQPLVLFSPNIGRQKTQEEPVLQFKCKGRETSQAGGVGTLEEGINPFVLCKSLTDWLRPTHTGESNLLYSSTYSNVNLIQKHPHRHTQNNIWQISEQLWLSQVDM